jgi:hypothetical protein
MKLKLLFWSAVLFFALGLKTGDSALFYFFSIHLFMLFIGLLLHKLAHKSRLKAPAESLPQSPASRQK